MNEYQGVMFYYPKKFFNVGMLTNDFFQLEFFFRQEVSCQEAFTKSVLQDLVSLWFSVLILSFLPVLLQGSF